MLHAWRQVRLLPIGWTELRPIWVEGVLGEVVRARSSGTEFMTIWMTIGTGQCYLLVHKIAVGSSIAPCEAAHRLSSVWAMGRSAFTVLEFTRVSAGLGGSNMD